MSEDKIQAQIVQWFNNQYCLKNHNPRSIIFSIPNGGYRNKAEAMKLKTTGTLAGVSDLIVIHLGKIYFIEIKDANGKQQHNQKEFEERVKLNGYDYHLIRTFEEFKTLIHSI